jgi:hypothetical protein
VLEAGAIACVQQPVQHRLGSTQLQPGDDVGDPDPLTCAVTRRPPTRPTRRRASLGRRDAPAARRDAHPELEASAIAARATGRRM